MSRIHYEKIAKEIRTVSSHVQNGRYLDLIDRLCVIFEEDNDRFDSDKFKRACGIAGVYHG